MVLADFKKYMDDVKVGLYLDDWHKSTLQTAQVRDNIVRTYTLNNPVKQHLIVKFDGL